MASSGENGTNGWPRFEWGPWLALLPVGLVVVFVNATSDLMEHARDGRPLRIWEPFDWELSSLILFMALAPLVGEAVRRIPPRRDKLPLFVAAHAALTLPFSVVHVAGMVALRKLSYWAVGGSYDFFDGAPLLTFLYEWRKDVLSYALIGAIYYLFRRRAAERAPLNADTRLELRDGAAATFVAPSDILFVEAAGNYVEFHTAGKTHLVRATLATWEAKLATRGFVRVHRSRLVNRGHIRALKPTPSGDVDITLSDGRTLLGSRRYRSALETAPTA